MGSWTRSPKKRLGGTAIIKKTKKNTKKQKIAKIICLKKQKSCLKKSIHKKTYFLPPILNIL